MQDLLYLVKRHLWSNGSTVKYNNQAPSNSKDQLFGLVDDYLQEQSNPKLRNVDKEGSNPNLHHHENGNLTQYTQLRPCYILTQYHVHIHTQTIASMWTWTKQTLMNTFLLKLLHVTLRD